MMGCERCGAARMFADVDPAGGGWLCLSCGARVWAQESDGDRRRENRRLLVWARLDPRTAEQRAADAARADAQRARDRVSNTASSRRAKARSERALALSRRAARATRRAAFIALYESGGTAAAG